MSVLYLEAYDPERGGWVLADTLHPGDRAGALTDNAPEGRHTYIYILGPGERAATIIRRPAVPLYSCGASLSPVACRLPPEDQHPLWTRVARLSVGGLDEYEMTITSDVGGRQQRVRFRLQDDSGEHGPERTSGGL